MCVAHTREPTLTYNDTFFLHTQNPKQPITAKHVALRDHWWWIPMSGSEFFDSCDRTDRHNKPTQLGPIFKLPEVQLKRSLMVPKVGLMQGHKNYSICMSFTRFL